MMKQGLLFLVLSTRTFIQQVAQAQLPPGDFIADLRLLQVGYKRRVVPVDLDPLMGIEDIDGWPFPPKQGDHHQSHQSCHNHKNNVVVHDYYDIDDDKVNEDKESRDPMLVPMPIDRPPYYYDVYVRKDISSFYQQEEPGSRTRVEVPPAFSGQACKFINISPFTMDLYWEDPHTSEKQFSGVVGPFESGGLSSFARQQYYFQRHDTKEIICRFTIEQSTVLYYCDPFVKFPGNDDNIVAKQGQYVGNHEILFSLDSLTSSELHQYEEQRYNLEFATLYKNFTGGSDWLANYGAPKPWHHMWRADYIGQEHVVQSKETHFVEIPKHLGVRSGKRYAIKRDYHDLDWEQVPFQKYRTPGAKKLNITIKAVSVEPRAFQLDNFLSEVEVDHVLEVINRHEMARSTTGNYCSGSGGEDDDDFCEVSNERTSTNTWIRRDESPILDAIYRRAADALRIDEALLRRRTHDEPIPDVLQGLEGEEWRQRESLNEDLQVVHYGETQEYTAHHDFGYDRNTRSINLCLYLNEGMVGGETSFVRWRNAETDQGLDMKPKKGKAMIFYMVNPDGNRDDLTQHAAKPVLEGEKYFANLWIWDPFKA